MYVRPPNNSHSELKLPENYSGNAFTRFSQYADMPPPVKTTPQRSDPSFAEDIASQENNYTDAAPEPEYQASSRAANVDVGAPGVKSGSLLSSLLPDFDLSRHFPFGHGIGGEELLILAVMLIIFVSGNERGEVDSELLLLLGLLLFAG